MKDNNELDRILDRALDDIASSEVDPQAEQSSAARVWEQLAPLAATAASTESDRQIRDCDDFQALIPAYLQDGLNDAKAMLLEDHLGECVPCRRALRAAQARRKSSKQTAAASAPSTAKKWAIRLAAAAVLFAFFHGLNIKTSLFVIEAGGLVTIRDIAGTAQVGQGDNARQVNAGETINFADVNWLRTGKDSSVLLEMPDSTTIEVDERAELAVKNRRKFWQFGKRDDVVDLDRGNIIIEAAKREAGNLYVDTADSLVAVTGTIFAVDHGVKGTRVSVVEGSVDVAYSGNHDTLLRGQQTTTQPGLQPTSIHDAVAWSRKLATYRALLDVATEIENTVAPFELRYDTTLLDQAPAGTALYVAMPNFSGPLGQAYDILQEKIGTNDVLSNWWNESVVQNGADDEIATAMAQIRSFGETVGEEIVVTLTAPAGDPDEMRPLIYAELEDADRFRDLVAEQLTEAVGDDGPDVLLLEGAVPGRPLAASADPSLFIWTYDDRVALSPEFDSIARFAAGAAQRNTDFSGSRFHGQLADLYSEGVEWVVGFDVASVLEGEHEDDEALSFTGIDGLEHVIAERKAKGDRTENRVALTFGESRHGLASWLAEPAPMGALDFISPDATLAAGFLMKEPTEVVDELFGFLAENDENFTRSLEEFEQTHGIDIRNDIAAAVGGEFAFALDGPVLPRPSWKLVVEVYDQVQLQRALQMAVDKVNEHAADGGFQGLALVESRQAGRTFFELQSLDTGLSAHYTFVDGYMVAGASRALLTRTLQFRDTGITLVGSQKFQSMLPADAQVHFSAAVYFNLGKLGESVQQAMQFFSSMVPPEQRQMMEDMEKASLPSLTVAYGEPDRILFVNTSEGGLFRSTIAALLRFETLLSVQELLGNTMEENGNRPEEVAVPVDATNQG